MPHPRQEIREGVAAAIVAASTGAGSRVYTSRIDPLRRDQTYPCVCVYVLSENVDDDAQLEYPRRYNRRAEILIEAWISTSSPTEDDDIADDIDDLALEIEAALDADPTYGGKAEDSWLSETVIEFGNEGAKSIGFAGIIYTALYRTDVVDAAPADDLDQVVTTYDVDAGDMEVDDRAVDDIEIETE